jgi:general secretion pathway protein A
MNLADTRDYIAHRIEVAGRKDSNLLTDGAVQQIYRFSGGLPRLINLACDRALLLGYTRERVPITGRMAATAIADVRLQEGVGGWLRRLPAAGIVLLVAVLAGAGLYGLNREKAPKPTTPATRPVAAPSQAPATASTARSFSLVTQELAGVTENESARAAFNVLAGLWHVAPVTLASPQPDLPEVLARERGLDTFRFSGNLGSLIRLDTPAILELHLPGISGRRYLALTGSGNGRFSIAPPLAGRTSLTSAELEGVWSGRASLPWKNNLDVSPGLKPGARGLAVSRLQVLLQEAGVYHGPITGLFDRPTDDAVRSFQAGRSLAADGAVGRQTLFLLYRAAGTYSGPTLTRSGGGS